MRADIAWACESESGREKYEKIVRKLKEPKKRRMSVGAIARMMSVSRNLVMAVKNHESL